MGMVDGLLGGIVGAGMVSVVNGIMERHGGLQGVVRNCAHECILTGISSV